jgi:hypothetical protein
VKEENFLLGGKFDSEKVHRLNEIARVAISHGLSRRAPTQILLVDSIVRSFRPKMLIGLEVQTQKFKSEDA